jgi:hypothetical protein
MFKKDKLPLGILLGILAPLITLVGYYFAKFFPTYGFKDFFLYFLYNKSLLTAIGTLCLLANLALFGVYINGKKDQTARGIFIVTLIYGIAVLAVKMF